MNFTDKCLCIVQMLQNNQQKWKDATCYTQIGCFCNFLAMTFIISAGIDLSFQIVSVMIFQNFILVWFNRHSDWLLGRVDNSIDNDEFCTSYFILFINLAAEFCLCVLLLIKSSTDWQLVYLSLSCASIAITILFLILYIKVLRSEPELPINNNVANVV